MHIYLHVNTIYTQVAHIFTCKYYLYSHRITDPHSDSQTLKTHIYSPKVAQNICDFRIRKHIFTDSYLLIDCIFHFQRL